MYKMKFSFLKNWLLSLMGLIVLIIIIGGLTRLTGSGLSMVDWNLFMGSVPPFGETAWNYVFNQYKNYPEYIYVNSSITLSEFKIIFMWEYIHRMLGRLIGVVILFGFVFILINKHRYYRFILNAAIMSVLVVSQGLLGWYMVKSGLIDIPRVSHFRLASHLALALILLEYVVWTYLGINKKKAYFSKLAIVCSTWTMCLCIQIVFGAFTSGLKAGWGYNTYPLMDGEFMPEAAFMFGSFIENVFYNPIMIQFIHRHFPLFLVVFFLILFIAIVKSKPSKDIFVLTWIVFGVLFAQIVLGIFTLLMVVPIHLASLHQVIGVVLLTFSVGLTHLLIYRPLETMKN
jgi:heme a synthase